MSVNNNIVVNELLAFLQQKLDVMDEVSAIQICKTGFSEDDISVAKRLLFTTLNKLDMMVSRRRDGTTKSLQDIITLLKKTDPDDVPSFVARDLSKLPPVTFDHVDVTSLLKDIVSLKASLADIQKKFEASQNTVSEMRIEINDLRASLTVSRSSPVKKSADMASISSPQPSAELAERRERSAPRDAPAAAPAAPQPRRAPARVLAAAAESKVPVRSHRNFASVTAEKKAVKIKPTTEPHASANIRDEDGFIEVRRKRARRRQRTNENHCGTAPTGPNFLLRAEVPTTPVYLSRLHHSMQVGDVIEYIRVKTNFTLRVQLLESRHNASFKAFVVRVPNFKLDTFLREDFWPNGVVFRRFRGRVPTPPHPVAHPGVPPVN